MYYIKVECRHGCYPLFFVILFFFLLLFFAGLYLVGEKGDKGLPGPPGRCDCDSSDGANNAPFGSYTQRGDSYKVPAVRANSHKTASLQNCPPNRIYVYIESVITRQLSLSPVCTCADICGKQ